MSYQDIPIEKIRIPETRLSAKFSPEQEAFFKASIEKLGVIHEPVVRRTPQGDYELIAGAHRLKELEAQGHQTVRCKIIEADDRMALEVNLIENIARGDYDPIELSQMLNRYLSLGATIEDIQHLTGHTREWVRFYLALEKLPQKYKAAISQGILKVGHIEAASTLPTPEEMAYALDLAIDLKWPVKVLQYYVKRRLNDLKLAKALEGEVAAPPKPTEAEAQQMVETYECAGCKRILHRTKIRAPPICDECWTLLRYCTDQFGPPTQAMGYIYEAASHHQKMLEAQQRLTLAQQQAQQLAQTPTPQQQPQQITSMIKQMQQPIAAPRQEQPQPSIQLPESPIPIEDPKLRSYIKRLIREMLQGERR